MWFTHIAHFTSHKFIRQIYCVSRTVAGHTDSRGLTVLTIIVDDYRCVIDHGEVMLLVRSLVMGGVRGSCALLLAAVVATAVFRPALLAARLRPLQLAVRPSPVSRRGVRQSHVVG